MPGIALITTSYPDTIPGNEAAGSFVEDFARQLSKSVPVSVIAASRRESLADVDDLTVRRFAVPRLPLSLLEPQKPSDWAAVLTTLQAGRKALHEAVVQAEPDHILALWALPSGWWADVEARRRGIAFSTWSLGSDIWSLGKIPLVRGGLKRVLTRARQRYADGLTLCADVERLCGKPCEFLPSTRHLSMCRRSEVKAEPPYHLAFLGRWHPNKGIDLFMDALQRLDNEDWQKIGAVRICGGGPLARKVHAIAGRLAGAGRPVIVGDYLDKSDAAELIGWCDYLVLPSRIESIPVIFSDCAQLGTPIIATPVGDLPRLRERYEFGVLATDVSADAITRAIRAAVSQNPARFGTGLREARTDFSLEASALRFLQDVGLI